MIHVDEEDPMGEIELSFPYRDVQFRRNVKPQEFYELQTEVGRGKFGTVYKCREKATGLQLAAKFIGVSKKEDRRNVEREVEIMRQLQHPRLIQVYDAFENGKVMCVILEFIEGGELFERVIDDDFILTEKSCAVFVRQICEGIDFIHKQNILHLDMKPENILCLTKTGNRIKIIDFGLARKFDPEKKLQVLFGTPEFVAPEVVNFDKIGFGTDMWSVGVICYVLLSGLSPFMGHTDIETMANVTVAKYDFDDEAFQDISEHAQDFIRKLLLKDMKQRMNAQQCLNHTWLQRQRPHKRPPGTAANGDTFALMHHSNHHRTSMDVAKENLRLFVERWSEHPNSPYVFEVTSHAIMPSSSAVSTNNNYQHHMLRQLSEESLVGLSPSPCGSLASSSPGSENAFGSEFLNIHQYAQIDHFRRASDSSYVLKGLDITDRVNLAEEIKKLSDKLFQLSTLPTTATSATEENNKTSAKKAPPTTIPPASKPIPISNGGCGTTSITTSTSTTNGMPWRNVKATTSTTKFKVSQFSRDVPLAVPTRTGTSSIRYFREDSRLERTVVSRSDSATSTSPTGTKDMLLRLLGHWDGPKNSTGRHGSISSGEWSETESLGQRTISSLNTFFQSRATKKISPFHKN